MGNDEGGGSVSARPARQGKARQVGARSGLGGARPVARTGEGPLAAGRGTRNAEACSLCLTQP